MNQNEMIQSIRAEISKLQRVLDLLIDRSDDVAEVRRPGRPKGSGSRATSFDPDEFAPKRRTMSAEGKARIAAAQKKRWAAQKATSSDGVTPKKGTSTKRSSKTAPLTSAGKVAPAAAKKSAAVEKGIGSTQARGQHVSAEQTTVTAKKSVGRSSVAKKTSRSATKSPAKQAGITEPQTTA